jgi:hypothetical protein
MRRGVFTPQPPGGDYILHSTGVTWGVRRMTDRGTAMIISAGETRRTVALALLLSLAAGDGADGWEPVGNGDFRLITVANAAGRSPGAPAASRISTETKPHSDRAAS